MAKVPEAGKVKTRLQSKISAAKAAEFAGKLLHDAIEKALRLQDQLIIAYSPFEQHAYFDEFSQTNIILVPQTGVDLGKKMFNAFNFAFEQKVDSIVMIGTDSPTFPQKFIENAFEYLKHSDTVLGESEDGGYYLIALKKLKKEIFEDVTWSSPETFKQTARNIEKCGLKLSLLPKWYDVDLPEDFERLRKDLRESPNLAPKTAEWLKKN